MSDSDSSLRAGRGDDRPSGKETRKACESDERQLRLEAQQHLQRLYHRKFNNRRDMRPVDVTIAGSSTPTASSSVDDKKYASLADAYEQKTETDEWLCRPLLPEEIGIHSVTMADFEEAVKIVQPSSQRDGFFTIPDVCWDDVGGCARLRKLLDLKIISPIKYPRLFKDFGMEIATGFLLYGPPGCGKSLIGRAVAGEAGANFIHIKGGHLFSKENESAIRTVFTRARACAPCIILFDEVDALRVGKGNYGDPVGERIIALLVQLLDELDDAKNRDSVSFIATTNRPDLLHPALLRRGRFDNRCYVPLPTPEERGLILKAIARGKPIDPNVDLIGIGQMDVCDDMSGADLTQLINEAAYEAVKEHLKNNCDGEKIVKTRHFQGALRNVFPTVSSEQMEYYEEQRKKIQGN